MRANRIIIAPKQARLITPSSIEDVDVIVVDIEGDPEPTDANGVNAGGDVNVPTAIMPTPKVLPPVMPPPSTENSNRNVNNMQVEPEPSNAYGINAGGDGPWVRSVHVPPPVMPSPDVLPPVLQPPRAENPNRNVNNMQVEPEPSNAYGINAGGDGPWVRSVYVPPPVMPLNKNMPPNVNGGQDGEA